MNDALIHLRVPASVKGRWIRESRTAGMKLSDWVVSIIEDHMCKQQMLKLVMPPDLDFSDLHITRKENGISFDWSAIERLCQASSIDVDIFKKSPEDAVAGLIIAWYQAHRENGGAIDLITEDLISEVTAEEKTGQYFSYPPGRG
jgi:hypothetical protein